MSHSLETHFASPERADSESISRDAQLLMQSALLNHLAETIPCILMILNSERQVVYQNQHILDPLGPSAYREMLGKRPGEIFNCTHASELPAGCGTSESCRECGAMKAILQSRAEETTVVNECRITTSNGEPYEFRGWASPYRLENREFTIVTFLDISDEKRRQALERTFFHDANNMLMPIVGFSEFLEDSDLPDDVREPINMIKNASKELAAEIASQKKLLQAEDKELSMELVAGISSAALVRELVHASAHIWSDKRIVQGEPCDDFPITTDRTLLYRVLYNMVKNAAEACSRNEVVSIRCFRDDSSSVFSVHNPNSMSRSIQLQVFQRSFSTKGKGRGIGTYSMKLFGEKYLKGKVWFSTSKDKGTTFSISIPLSYKDA